MFVTRSLHMFIAVAEELHFGRAASRLRMTQPPLSQQMRELEKRLNAQLFARTTREVRLTAAGKLLLERARRLRAEGESAELAVRQIGLGKAGSLAFRFVNSAVYELVPKIIQHYRAEAPEVDLDVKEMDSRESVEALLTNRIDVALVRLPHTAMQEPSLEFHLIASEHMLLALRREHSLARSTLVRVQDLEEIDFVHYDPIASPYFRGVTDRIFLRAQVRPRVVYESLLPTMLSLVEGGMGVGMVPAGMSRMFTDRLVYRPLKGTGKDGVSGLWCVFRRGDTNPLVLNFFQLIKGLATPRTGRRVRSFT